MLDHMAVVGGDAKHAGRTLGALLLNLDVDLERAAHLDGMTAHVGLLATHGGHPSVQVGVMQGIDSIEAPHARQKLFEAWVEAPLGQAASLRVGLYDINSEFELIDTSRAFIAPSLPISLELAATGPAGVPTFPSTSLGARLQVRPAKDVYLRVAAVNAQAGDPGDPGGLDTSFDAGALVLAEGGWTGRGKVALGTWRYTRRQARPFAAPGAPETGVASGVYAFAEQPLHTFARGTALTGFARVGRSDGHSGPFRGSGAVGLVASKVMPGRDGSTAGLALTWSDLAKDLRDVTLPGPRLSPREATLELTYSDQLTKHLTVQPDLQFIRHPGGDSSRPDAIVAGVRFTAIY